MSLLRVRRERQERAGARGKLRVWRLALLLALVLTLIGYLARL